MDLKEIQELIKILNKSNISEIRIERDNFKILLRTHDANPPVPIIRTESVGPQPVYTAPPATIPPVQTASPPAGEATPKGEASSDESKLVTIKSPMIGTFYRSSSPDKPPLVNVGDEIQAGSVLCIIEAMKLFNEIESEHTGRIVKILVENAKPVEYDQPLFLIEPM
jgi:acetyl-CoA carboxylase biotin carboxyl carrier protein